MCNVRSMLHLQLSDGTAHRSRPLLFCLINAGFETTAHTICWALLLIATHPEVEARVLAELAALGLAASPDKPQPGTMKWEHLAQVRRKSRQQAGRQQCLYSFLAHYATSGWTISLSEAMQRTTGWESLRRLIFHALAA